MVNYAYGVDPNARRYAPGRLARTEARFISAAVEVYCPGNESKIASIVHRVAAYTRGAADSRSDLRKPPPALDMINMPAAWQEPRRSGVMGLPQLMNGGAFVGAATGTTGRTVTRVAPRSPPRRGSTCRTRRRFRHHRRRRRSS
jgi:hypothetical protein